MDWSDLGVQSLNLFFGIVGPIITALVMGLLVQWLRKVGVNLEADKQAQINDLLYRLVAQTEEWAAGKLKLGQPVTAQDKAQYYLKLVSAQAEKLPGVTADAAVDVSKQVLGTAKLAAKGQVIVTEAAAVSPLPEPRPLR